MNAKGAHFIQDDISLFDASFFNFSSEVASVSTALNERFIRSYLLRSWIPKYDYNSNLFSRLRKTVNTTHEAQTGDMLTIPAGLPLHRLAGSKTSVTAGCFVHDYNDSLTRDPDTLPRTTLTGNGTAMISNRVSHFFDLRGPSMTVDTGCSTSLTALHLGCQSLRAGDADMSIVTAANMLINPDNFIILSSLGYTPPRSRIRL